VRDEYADAYERAVKFHVAFCESGMMHEDDENATYSRYHSEVLVRVRRVPVPWPSAP
jgi:hypothetical protein